MTTNAPTDEITAVFTHPRSAKRLRVAIGRTVTGKAALEQLQKQKDFFPPGSSTKSLSLVCERTKQTLPLGSSLVEAGLQDGDVVAVTEVQEGHARRSAA